jgi:hypothetical protein
MVTLPKRMLPMGLNDMRRLLYSVLHSKGPTLSAATASLSPASKVVAATAVLEAEPTTTTSSTTAVVHPSAQPLRFVDAPVQDIIGDIATDAAVPLPKLPPARPLPKGSGPQAPGLQERRKAKQLRPGQLDPDASPFGRREKELRERRSYLKNFWYAAGELHEGSEGSAAAAAGRGAKLRHCCKDICRFSELF